MITEREVLQPAASENKVGFYRRYFTLFGLALAYGLLVPLSLHHLTPPRPVPPSAALDQFSSGRAMQRLQLIADRPRPSGSFDHARVRDYIVAELAAMMLNPEVQRTTAISETQRRPVVAATVENVFARLPGSESTKAILLLCHYDSVQNGPGASDDGAAVAAMLEAARALLAGPKLKNDVVFLFSDAEEVGQLGAQAFVDQSPMASDIGIVLNFEARGTGGPSIMFESSNDDGWLIEGLARAAPFPVANSLGPEVYKRLPNDTDLTIFKRNGFSGMNFAFIDGVARYHTKMDSLEEVDQASLQHHGSYMVSLARYFGNLNLEHTRSKNHIYFTLPGSILIHYRQDLALPLLALVTLLLIAMVVVGFKMKQLSFYGIFVGFMALLLSAACSAGGISLAWVLIRFVRNDYLSVSQDPAKNDSLYLLGFTVLAIAITLGIYGLLGKKTPVQDMIVGGLIWWLVGALITSIYLPDTSFLFVWPLLFSILPLAYLFWSGGRASTTLVFRALLFLFAIPGFLLFVPVIYLLFLADFWRAISIIAVMTVFLGSLLSPALTSITFTRKWLLPLGAALASIGLLTTALLTDRFDSRHPFTDNIFYAVNTVSGKAVWSTIDRAPDEWTSQFFAKGVETGSLTDCLPFSNARFMKSQAPTIPLAAPDVVLVGDQSNSGIRTLHIKITSHRRAPVIMVSAPPSVDVLAFSLNNREDGGQTGKPWGLVYYGAPYEGIDLVLQIKSSIPITLMCSDLSYGLPPELSAGFKPRPAYIIASPLLRLLADSCVASKSAQF